MSKKNRHPGGRPKKVRDLYGIGCILDDHRVPFVCKTYEYPGVEYINRWKISQIIDWLKYHKDLIINGNEHIPDGLRDDYFLSRTYLYQADKLFDIYTKMLKVLMKQKKLLSWDIIEYLDGLEIDNELKRKAFRLLFEHESNILYIFRNYEKTYNILKKYFD